MQILHKLAQYRKQIITALIALHWGAVLCWIFAPDSLLLKKFVIAKYIRLTSSEQNWHLVAPHPRDSAGWLVVYPMNGKNPPSGPSVEPIFSSFYGNILPSAAFATEPGMNFMRDYIFTLNLLRKKA